MTPGAILVVDGKAESRAGLVRVVKEAGYSVLEAGTGAEALALLSSLHPQLVLLDVDQLDANALDLARQVKLESADVPVIILSATGERDLVVKAMRTGAYDFLVKPVAGQALKDVLKAALAQTDAPPIIAAPGSNGSAGSQAPLDIDLLFRNSERMRAVEDIVRRAADTNATILLQGESGTGKEMVARAIHYISDRRDKPFLKVNCASLPGDLLESELFGHEKGSFTGAHRRKPGKFELAHRGTFLLDEIGEMPLGLQAKLLHVLQDGQFFRVGGSEVITSDARLIAATNRNLASVMTTGMFREDLYYRLNVVAISIPPLRERREEIPVLVEYFMGRFCRQYNRDALKISAGDHAPAPGLLLARQRPGAREHDQAGGGPPDRGPRAPGDRPPEREAVGAEAGGRSTARPVGGPGAGRDCHPRSGDGPQGHRPPGGHGGREGGDQGSAREGEMEPGRSGAPPEDQLQGHALQDPPGRAGRSTRARLG